MRNPAYLTREQLTALVEGVQQQLYLEVDSQGRVCWNPDKAWKAADVCEQNAQLLSQQDLVPDRLRLFHEAAVSAVT